jgi:Neuraminidase (sialidase)
MRSGGQVQTYLWKLPLLFAVALNIEEYKPVKILSLNNHTIITRFDKLLTVSYLQGYNLRLSSGFSVSFLQTMPHHNPEENIRVFITRTV